MTWSWPERPRRVVVTGMGTVNALGQDVSTFWDNLVAGRSGVRTITTFDPSRVSAKIAAEVKDFDPSGVLDRKDMRRTDRYIQFALVCARQALEDAGLPGRLDDETAARTGVIVGSGLGGVSTLFDNVLVMADSGPGPDLAVLHPDGHRQRRVGAGRDRDGRHRAQLRDGVRVRDRRPCTGRGVGDDPPRRRRHHDRGRRRGRDPRGDGRRLRVDEGAVDPQRRPRGGVPARSTPVATASSWARAARWSSSKRSRTAEARGATPLAELVGYGATADASHITLPAPGGIGAVRAARRALDKAGLDPAEVQHVNAHATSTPEGDRSELQAIRTIFGDHAPNVAISANKSMLGHTLGAAGAIEAIATILAIREGCIPPTINLDQPDELAAGLDLTPNVASRRDVTVALSNSFGFGGQNTALVFRRWDG